MIHGDVLGERARLTPSAPALVEVATGRRFTYAELDRRAARCGSALTGALGLAPGDRVGLLCGNRVEFLDVFFAAGKTGVVVVPMNTRLAAPELAAIVRDAGMRALIYDGGSAPAVAALKDAVELERWVAVDRPLPGDDSLAALAERGAAASPAARPGPEDLYCLLYTSGTTGRPKGVMVPHRMVSWNGLNTVACWQLRADDVSPIFTPLYHAGGLGAFLVPIFTVGGTIMLHARFDAGEVWRTIEAERCTVVLGVPTIWTMLAEAPEFESVDLAHVRWFISGGAPLPTSLIERYRSRGVILRQGYGLTEVGVNCFAMTDADAWERPGSIGKPLMFTEARLVDEDGAEVPVGEVGELLLRGPHVSAGYWRNPEATAAALDTEGWFHTGDLARRDEDGFFFIAGRRKEMFISGGVNIYPAEVESALLEHPAVSDAAVVGVPDPKWGEAGVAFVVPGEGAGPSPGELAGFLEERLARYKVPKRFVFVDELPRTAYGKVRRAALAAMVADEKGDA